VKQSREQTIAPLNYFYHTPGLLSKECDARRRAKPLVIPRNAFTSFRAAVSSATLGTSFAARNLVLPRREISRFVRN